MQQILVDSNVILDIFTQDANWFDWSAKQLETLADTHLLAINPIIYAEVSIRFSRIEALEQALPTTAFKRLTLPMEAAFLAGKAYMQYKKRQGKKLSTMPDFYIGAHAAVENMKLLTRDINRYKTYFPSVTLITP
jgi:hypothetical protein